VRDRIRAHGAEIPEELIVELIELFDAAPFIAKREIAAGFLDCLRSAANTGALPGSAADLIGLCLGLDDRPLLMAAVHGLERMRERGLRAGDLAESGILAELCEAVDRSGDDFLRSKVERICEL
jgi:hypothetical protein